MGVRIVVAEGERLTAALRRLQRHLDLNRMVLPPRKRHFIKKTEIRRAKKYRKRYRALLATLLAKSEGRE